MKIRISLIAILLFISSCSSRRTIENANLTYIDKNISVKVKITHKKKIDDSYFYYGEMESSLNNSIKVSDIDIPYLIATYKNQKSKFYYDYIANYPDFFASLKWSKEIKRNNIYIAFDMDVNLDEIVLKAIDKKFKYFPLDFYDH